MTKEGISAAVVTGVNGIGTSKDDELGYVLCNFDGGESRAIAFSPDIAANLCSSFLMAAGHLEAKAAMRRQKTGEIPRSTPTEIAKISVAVGIADGKSDSIIISLSTKSGAALHFEFPIHLIQKLERDLPLARAKLNTFPKSSALPS